MTEEQEAAYKDWRKSWGLRRVPGRCLHWVAKGRCDADECPQEGRHAHQWMDHISCWSGPNSRVKLYQPYHLDADDLRDIAAVAEQHGLEVSVTGKGWYGHGTVAVMFVGAKRP